MRKPHEIESLYIDFDAFFANVEKQLNPDIRNRPLGITALDSRHSALITRCYMAKAAGVKRGMRVTEAQDICPDIVIRQARPDVYVDIHNRILDVIGRHVPVAKVWSIDEAECQLIGSERHRAHAIAEDIRIDLARLIGPYVTPSIGLAPNQFLAKVAAEMDKPNGLVALHPDALPGPLLGLKLTDLPGISENMEKRLNAAGITTIDAFWNITAKHARKIWNNVEGERLWLQLHGYAVTRPPTQKRMFGHSRVLSLRRAEFLAGTLSISLRAPDQPRWWGERRFAPATDDFTFIRHMRDLYAEGLTALGHPRRLKATSVMLHNLARHEDLAYDLFTETQSSGKQESFDKIMGVIDTLNMKHGRALLHVGTRAKLPGGYAGAKIAFGRVPDKEDFY